MLSGRRSGLLILIGFALTLGVVFGIKAAGPDLPVPPLWLAASCAGLVLPVLGVWNLDATGRRSMLVLVAFFAVIGGLGPASYVLSQNVPGAQPGVGTALIGMTVPVLLIGLVGWRGLLALKRRGQTPIAPP